jgi:prepilin-type N-terminal cleavage/methylation domain-containing protein
MLIIKIGDDMKKRGFTLVELLAVIAILAILVILALPNVIDLFKSARKNSFLSEVNSLYTSARNEYMLNAFSGNGSSKTYTNVSENNKLKIQGGTGDFKYCVTVDGSGNITKVEATNGTFKYESNVIANNATIDNVSEVEEGYELSCASYSTANQYVYFIGVSDVNRIGDTLTVNNTDTFDNYSDAINTFGYPIFTAHKVDNSNKITESSIGFVLNGNAYTLPQITSLEDYEANKARMINIFGISNCSGDISLSGQRSRNKFAWLGITRVKAKVAYVEFDYVTCSLSGITIRIDDHGSIYARTGDRGCELVGTESFGCYFR